MAYGAYFAQNAFFSNLLECTVAAWASLAPSGSVQADLRSANDRTAAPELNLKDARGKDVRLSDLKGQVVVVNFWATWCHGCQIEIPWFIEFEKKYGDRGLAVIGVSMDDDGWKAVKPWMKEKRVNYPIVIGNENLGKQFGLAGMPWTLLIDRDGKIADGHAGVVDKEATEKKIATLLEEHAN
jgi:cytochrome c biogenesis protein CcmG/thiol:disulfide interchange protein DsbE